MWNDHHCPEEKRDPEQLISSGEAAWILGIDSKTVRRRFAAGKISGFRIDRGVLFRRIDVLRHREHMRDMAKYEGIMRTAYVFDQFGYLDFANYDWTPDGKMMDVKSGLAAYKMQRARIIEPMGVDPADVFMVGEILARLNISDPHVVYTLVRDGLLLPYDRFRSGANGRTNGQRMLVKKDSFAGYLGKDVPERFFNTAYLADEVGRPVGYVSRRVRELNARRAATGAPPIGRKINEHRRQSNYLFTLGDICEFRDVCGFYS